MTATGEVVDEMNGDATLAQQPADFSKRREGLDEVILDQDLPIVDSHHHLFDRPTLRYMFDDYLQDVGAGHKIVASVYVETKQMVRIDGPDILRPIGEVEFANGIGAMSAGGGYGPCRVAAAIVGFADLSQGDAVAELLDRSLSCAPDRFRGVRMTTLETPNQSWRRYVVMPLSPVSGVLASSVFREGFRHLAPRQLTYDASIFHNQLPELSDLARDNPGTTIVLGHMGLALALDMDESERLDIFDQWSRGLRELAHRPNVVCKVGGLGLPFWGFGLEERAAPVGFAELAKLWEPYVETAIEAFGVNRCMMESNFPPDGRSCGYVPMWNALKQITRNYTVDEKRSLFHDTAARVYRIDADNLGSPRAASPRT